MQAGSPTCMCVGKTYSQERFIDSPAGTPAATWQPGFVVWRGVYVLSGCTCALCVFVCVRALARGGVSAPEPVRWGGGWMCRPHVYATRRPWKGQRKVTGGQRVGRSQRFLYRLSTTSFK